MEDIDREEFYSHLKDCNSTEDIKRLIENIDSDELQIVIQNRYEQYVEFNKDSNIDIKDLIKILEDAFLKFNNTNNN